jgi:3-oxoacyl-[acyl-carrier-protein] synthase-3
VTNFDLEEMGIDTSDDWIRTRTGIHERRIVTNGLRQSDLSLHASREALMRVGWSPDDLDLIIVATVTPDHIFPASANTLAAKLGAVGVGSFDLVNACSGFIYGIFQASAAIESGRANRVLVVGSEIMSSILDWEDRATCVLFGDGAAAVCLEAVEEPYGFRDFILGSDGRYGDLLYMPGGGSAMPASNDSIDRRQHFIKMNGGEVFKFAVKKMKEVSEELLERAGITPEDIGVFIPHQANIRIIDACTKRLGLKKHQVVTNIHKYGNTTSATIPTAIYEAEAEGRINKGDWILLVTFGAGLTWGGTLMQWAVDKLPSGTSFMSDDAAYDSYSSSLRPGQDFNRL